MYLSQVSVFKRYMKRGAELDYIKCLAESKTSGMQGVSEERIRLQRRGRK